MLKLLTIIVMIACVVIASASSTTTSKSVDATHTKDPQMEKFMNELTPKQRECFKESWKKDKDTLKALKQYIYDESTPVSKTIGKYF